MTTKFRCEMDETPQSTAESTENDLNDPERHYRSKMVQSRIINCGVRKFLSLGRIAKPE